MTSVRSARWWHLATFVAGVFGLLLQLWLSATHALAYDGHVFSAAVRVWNYLSFFTIWSNILVTVTAWLFFRDPQRHGRLMSVVHLASLIMITVTGLIYAIVLAPIWSPTGFAKVADQTLHYLVPVLAVLSYIVVGPRPRFGWRVLWQMIPIPLVWAAYTVVRSPFIGYPKDGITRHWWPYHFINVDDLGYGKVLVNMLGVTVLLLAIGVIYVLLDRKLPARPLADARQASPIKA